MSDWVFGEEPSARSIRDSSNSSRGFQMRTRGVAIRNAPATSPQRRPHPPLHWETPARPDGVTSRVLIHAAGRSQESRITQYATRGRGGNVRSESPPHEAANPPHARAHHPPRRAREQPPGHRPRHPPQPARLLLQEAKCQASNDSQVLGRMPASNSTIVFGEGHVQRSMQLVLHVPVPTNRL